MTIPPRRCGVERNRCVAATNQAAPQVIRLNPDALDLYNYIADNYFQMNQPERAIAALQRGLSLATARADRIKMESFTNRIRDKD